MLRDHAVTTAITLADYLADELAESEDDPGLHARLIQQLGGYVQVSRIVSRNPSTIWRWEHFGIPPIQWPRVAMLARMAGLSASMSAMFEQIAAADPKRAQRIAAHAKRIAAIASRRARQS